MKQPQNAWGLFQINAIIDQKVVDQKIFHTLYIWQSFHSVLQCIQEVIPLKSKTVSVRLPESLNAALERVAKELDVSKSWVIRKLIENGLEDLYEGEIAKRRLINPEWVSHEEVEKRFMERKMGKKSAQRV